MREVQISCKWVEREKYTGALMTPLHNHLCMDHLYVYYFNTAEVFGVVSFRFKLLPSLYSYGTSLTLGHPGYPLGS